MQGTALIRPGEIDQWDQALYAFLAEKERRSGSMRTVQSYSRMLQHFFGLVAKTPERITSPEVFSWAHGIGLSGKRPSSITIGARLACLSSFYRFLIRMGLMAANPCEAIERPKTVPSQLRGLSANEIRKLLASSRRRVRSAHCSPTRDMETAEIATASGTQPPPAAARLRI